MTVIDRRASGKNKSVGNRQKFIKRYKNRIKKNIDSIASEKGITDVLKDRKVTIPEDDMDEPNFNYDMTKGERDVVLPGNKNLQNGDKIHRPPQDEDEGNEGSNEGEGFDEFSFVLTKEEFLELYFSDLCLPAFIKESLKGSTKHKFKRTGYSKDGIPARLDLVKTLKQAMARRIATKASCDCEFTFEHLCKKCDGTRIKKARYLDDIDMRYKHFTKQPFPIKQATMICLMDVSGSMGEFEKGLAKKFFLLLYLFLNKVYKNVEVIFVSHTIEAKEVTEHEFFYGNETGGTVVSSGLELVNKIIDERLNLSENNVYIAQASDGDNWTGDDDISSSLLEEILKKVQYFAYIQTEEEKRWEAKQKYRTRDLMTMYTEVATRHKNLQARNVRNDSEVYPVLRSLFEGGN